MKQLILTSAAYRVMDELERFLPKSPRDSKVIFIPTASDPYVDKPWLEADLSKLRQMRFQVEILDIKDKTRNELESFCSLSDIIFIAGGNTYYLLEKMRASGFDKLAKDLLGKGVIYIGSSAGSVVAGPDINYVKRLDDPYEAPLLNDFRGLQLVDFIVLSHWGSPKYKERFKETMFDNYDNKYPVIPLRDTQAIVVEGDKFSILTA